MSSQLSEKLLAPYAGRNTVERAIIYLTARQPGFAQLTWSEQVKSAGDFVRQLDREPVGPEGAKTLMSGDRVFGEPVKTELKNALKDDGPKADETPSQEEDDEDGTLLKAAANLAKLLADAVKAGDTAAIRALMSSDDEEEIPTDAEDRRKAVEACHGRNEIEKSAMYLLSHPKTAERFNRVPLALRPFCAGQFLRKGDVTWAEVLR